MLLPQQHILHRGWRILIPHEDKVDVINPVNILFIGGWWILIPHDDKDDDYDDGDADHDDGDADHDDGDADDDDDDDDDDDGDDEDDSDWLRQCIVAAVVWKELFVGLSKNRGKH